MQKFHCDKRTKCRNASGSLTSGNAAGVLRASEPKSLLASASGTSSGAIEPPKRFAAPRSKMGGSRNLVPRGCVRVMSFSWGLERRAPQATRSSKCKIRRLGAKDAARRPAAPTVEPRFEAKGAEGNPKPQLLNQGEAGSSGLPFSVFSPSHSPPPTSAAPLPPIELRSGLTLRCFTPSQGIPTSSFK